MILMMKINIRLIEEQNFFSSLNKTKLYKFLNNSIHYFTWEQNFISFSEMEQRKLHKPKRAEGTRYLRKLHNKEFHNFYPSENIPLSLYHFCENLVYHPEKKN